MKRVIVICEGETEQEFCNSILMPYFLEFDIQIQNPRIKKSMGGIVKWQDLKKQIETHLKTDNSAYVTLLIDYYGLYDKHNFPAWDEAEATPNKNTRMDILEEGMAADIDEAYRYRFLPYIQLHEFEGLLFNNLQVFIDWIPNENLVGMAELTATLNQYDNPEMINNNPNTSPSHRLERIIRGYEKVLDGNILADAIGLDSIREKSPRFNQWIENIEELSE